MPKIYPNSLGHDKINLDLGHLDFMASENLFLITPERSKVRQYCAIISSQLYIYRKHLVLFEVNEKRAGWGM